MIAMAFVFALGICPADAVIDRIEARSIVVLGASGVHVIARESVRSSRPHGAREGDRLLGWIRGECSARAPTRAERDEIRRRVGQLMGRGAGPPPPRPRSERVRPTP